MIFLCVYVAVLAIVPITDQLVFSIIVIQYYGVVPPDCSCISELYFPQF